jgi:protein-disulfide isomerase
MQLAGQGGAGLATKGTPRLSVPVGERDHVAGPVTAAVTLVEYGDYECPFCKAAEPIVAALRDALGDHLRLVFRHFPVANIHPHAERAAEVAEAAGAQGKFWDLHPYLFAHQDALDDADLMRYARDVDLDTVRVEKELTGHVHRERVREDLTNGMQSGVRGTPTFFIEGIKYDGPPDLQAMLAVMRGSHPEISADIKETSENMRVPRLRE